MANAQNGTALSVLHRFIMRWASIPITLSNLTLANTLPVGQSFLWHRYPVEVGLDGSEEPVSPEEFSRAVDQPPRVVRLRQTPSHLYYTAIYPDSLAAEADCDLAATRRWLHDYFQLDHDLDTLYTQWRRLDPYLFGKVELNDRAIGVRLLRQDPWECLVAYVWSRCLWFCPLIDTSFITSTNNHISRITSLLHKLSHRYSPRLLQHHQRDYHLFPPPHVFPVAIEPTLREMGFGYRASFLESSLATLRTRFGSEPGQIERGLLEWRAEEVDTVRNHLLELKGVGRKVADCVMLMCLDQVRTIWQLQ